MLRRLASGSCDAARAAENSDDEDSVLMRLIACELHWRQFADIAYELRRDLDRMSGKVELLHQHLDRTNGIVHELQNQVEYITSWTQWLNSLWRWAVSSMRSFPWP